MSEYDGNKSKISKSMFFGVSHKLNATVCDYHQRIFNPRASCRSENSLEDRIFAIGANLITRDCVRYFSVEFWVRVVWYIFIFGEQRTRNNEID